MSDTPEGGVATPPRLGWRAERRPPPGFAHVLGAAAGAFVVVAIVAFIVEVTSDDPGTYKQPFTTVGRATLMPGAELMEYICQENNQDVDRLSGPARGPGNQ